MLNIVHLTQTVLGAPVDDVQAAVADDAEVLSSGYRVPSGLKRAKLHLANEEMRIILVGTKHP